MQKILFSPQKRKKKRKRKFSGNDWLMRSLEGGKMDKRRGKWTTKDQIEKFKKKRQRST